jgi:hypothetical protein
MKNALTDSSFIAMTRCFVCGGSNEILLHRRFKDIREFNDKVISKEPCNKCKAYMAQGIIVISIRDHEADQENPYRTGGWWVVKESALKDIFPLVDFTKQRVIFMEDSACAKIGLQKQATGNNSY